MIKGIAFREYLRILGKNVMSQSKKTLLMRKAYRKWKIIQLYKTK